MGLEYLLNTLETEVCAMSETFGRLVKSMLEQRQLSQRGLAKLIGKNHTYISKIESGKERPSSDVVVALAKALGADSAELQLAAGQLPHEYAEAIRERPEVRRLVDLAASGKLPERFYKKLDQFIEKEARVNVPVWLE